MTQKVSVTSFRSASSGKSITLGAVAGQLIGILVKQINKKIEEARKGDYSATGVEIGDETFPDHSYILVVRTIKDPDSRFTNIASVGELLDESGKSARGARHQATCGGRLLDSITNSQGPHPSAGDLRNALVKALGDSKENRSDRIALLAICPVIPLGETTNGEARLYGIGLSGAYYPLLAGARFQGESYDLYERISKAKESMTLEVYGPNGSGYSTGLVKVPLVWSPPKCPNDDAEWVTSERIRDEIKRGRNDKDGDKALASLFEADFHKRLQQRSGFVPPYDDYRDMLCADVKVSETSEATGWIVKLVEQAADKGKAALKN